MENRTWLLALVIVIWIVAQFGLAGWALRDLWQRPRVRGDNKVVWALMILMLPVVGPLVYSSFGPTSFLPRPGRPRPPVSDPEDHS
ncbi:MAG: PLDc N-terminal domain-containing protein [Chloroflexia bacterium]|nr:PLDc N-terminal domain-containing protein [Chloroflexia bacterium]